MSLGRWCEVPVSLVILFAATVVRPSHVSAQCIDCGGAAVSVDVTPSSGSTPPRYVNTGPHTYMFTVRNTGTDAATFALSCSPSGVTCSLNLTSVSLTPLKDTVVVATYHVGSAGPTGVVRVRATSGAATDEGSVTVPIVSPSLSITRPPAIALATLASGSAVFDLRNTGSNAEPYTFSCARSGAVSCGPVTPGAQTLQPTTIPTSVAVGFTAAATAGPGTITLRAQHDITGNVVSETVAVTVEQYGVLVIAGSATGPALVDSTQGHFLEFRVRNTGTTRTPFDLVWGHSSNVAPASLPSRVIVDAASDSIVRVVFGVLEAQAASHVTLLALGTVPGVSVADSARVEFDVEARRAQVTPADTAQHVFAGTLGNLASFNVRNVGSRRDTFALGCTSPSGSCTVNLSPATVVLDANSASIVGAVYGVGSASGNLLFSATTTGRSAAGSIPVAVYQPAQRVRVAGSAVVSVPVTSVDTVAFDLRNESGLPDVVSVSCVAHGVVSCNTPPWNLSVHTPAPADPSVRAELGFTASASSGTGYVVLVMTGAGGTSVTRDSVRVDVVHVAGVVVRADGPPLLNHAWGTSGSYPFVVRNTGTRRDTFGLSCADQSPIACDSVLLQNSVELAAADSASVVVPFYATTTGTNGSLTLRATSVGAPGVTAAATVAINSVVPTIAVTADVDTVRRQHDTGTYDLDFTIQNNGSALDYRMSCTPGGRAQCGWPGDSIVHVSPGSMRVAVSYGVSGVGPGAITLTLESLDSIAVRDSARVFVGSEDFRVSVAPQQGQSPTRQVGIRYTETYQIHNTGTARTDYHLACRGGGEIVCTHVDPSVSVERGDSAAMAVEYVGNSAGLVGNSLTLVATSADWPNASDSGSYTIPLVSRGVTVTPKLKKVGVIADSSYTFRFTVANRGSQPELFGITATCTAVVTSCHTTAAAVTIAPGADSILLVGYDVLPVAVGDTGSVAITVQQISDTAVVGVGRILVAAGTPRAPLVSLEESGTGSPPMRSLCVVAAAGSGGVSECGTLRLTHALPAVRTLDQVRTPLLTYNNDLAHPYNLVAANVFLPDSAVTPDSVRAFLRIGTVLSDTTTFAGFGWSPGRASRIVVGMNGFGRETGIYPYTLEVVAFVGAVGFPVTSVGEITIVNRRASRYGAGWWLAGVEQLVFVPGPGDRILWVGGDGSGQVYEKVGPAAWVGPSLSRPDSLRLQQIGPDSVYVRSLAGGGRIVFDQQGRHVQTVNRLGHTTRFEYDPSINANIPAKNRVMKIWVPLPGGDSLEAYRLLGGIYLDRVLTLPGKPEELVTRILRSGPGIDRIVDPDGSAVSFGYIPTSWEWAIDWREDRRGYRTDFIFDSAHRLIEARTAMDPGQAPLITALRPFETVGLASAVDTAEAYTLIDGLRTDVGDTTMVFHDRIGGPGRIVDAHGAVTTLEYGDAAFPALVTSVTDPRGFESHVAYDARGNLDSTYSQRAVGLAVTRYAWNPQWDALEKVVQPEGDSTRLGYDPANGNRLWQEDGRGAASRVWYRYNAAGQIEEVDGPETPAMRLEYDALGNLSAVESPQRLRSEFFKDAFGRDTLVATPIDVGLAQLQRFRYDAAGRVDSAWTVGPDIPGTDPIPAETLLVVNDYDVAGNLRFVKRFAFPDLNAIDSVVSEYRYDAAGRTVAEVQYFRRDSTVYDEVGNPVELIQAGGDTLFLKYDALNRLTQRIVPEKRYSQTGCGHHFINIWWHCTDSLVFPYYANDSSGLLIHADTARFSYDATGNLLTARNRYSKIRRSYYRDGALESDSLRMRSYGDSTSGAAFDTHVYGTIFEYDLNGRRISMSHPAGLAPSGAVKQTYQYHAYGPLATVSHVLGHRFDFSYDLETRLRRLTFPGGSEDRSYDPDGRLVRRVEQAAFLLRSDSVTYDHSGRMTRVERVAGPSNYWAGTLRYSGLGHLVESAGTDAAGQALRERFVTDALGHRVWSGTAQAGDSMRVRKISEYGTGGTLTRLRADTVSWDPAQPFHADTTYRVEDGHGNVRRQGSRQHGSNGQPLSWPSARNWNIRLASESYYGADQKMMYHQVYRDSLDFEAGGVARDRHGVFEEYWYDALGRRILKRVRSEGLCKNTAQGSERCYSTIERFVWDGDQVLYEIRYPGGDGLTGNALDRTPPSGASADSLYGWLGYTHGPGIDVPLAITRMAYQGAPHITVVPHYNYRGVADAGTDVSGNRFGCLPGQTTGCTDMGWPGVYGAAFHDANSTDDGVRNPPAWFGSLVQQQRDQSGLLYMRNRYYDPATGQFTQQDPIGIAGGLNLYGFAEGDPVNLQDPFGLCIPDCLIDLAFVAADIADIYRNGATWGRLGALGADLVSAALPFVPAVFGVAGRGVRAGDAILNSHLVDTFEGGAYTAVKLTEDLPVARVFGGESPSVGRFFTNQSFLSGGAARNALQLPPGNTANKVVQAVIPKGTMIFVGGVAGSTSGAAQIVVNSEDLGRVAFGAVKQIGN